MSATNLDVKGANAVAGWLAAAETRAEAAKEPAWMLTRRRHAAQVAASLPFPSRENELWRRTDLSQLPIESLEVPGPAPRARNVDDLPAAVIERLAGEAANAALLVQRDGDVVLEQTHPTLQKQGVVVCSMERAIREHQPLLEAHFGALLATDYDRWVAIGEALRTGGVFVHVPKGVQAELPVRLFQWIDGGRRLVAPRSVIAVGEQASITVLDEMLSDTSEDPSLYLGGIEMSIGRGGKLTFASIQDWSRNVFHYGNARVDIGADAELQWVQVMVGGKTSKQHSWYNMAGQGAQGFVHGFMFGDHRQHFHLHTLQRHLAPNCTSDLLIKGCLKDKARSVYQGLIQVAEGAQRTDAYQANRNLLLSDQARADSIPGLEILANDVRCTHGATLGHVDSEHLYYLMARGLPRADAQRLIVEAFFEPVIERVPLESVRERLRAEIARKLG